MPTERSKYWCWTLNNYNRDELLKVRKLVENNSDVNYVIFGIEEADSGTPHLQGYLELEGKLRLGGVKLLDGLQRAHFESRKGTQTQAIEYCQKDGTYEEFGVKFTSKQGKRNDLELVKKLLDDGGNIEDVAEQHFKSYVKHRKAFQDYISLKNKKRARDPKVVVLWGEPGVGKTRWVFEKYGDKLWIAPDPSLQWFDTYDGERVVLIDDFRTCSNPSFLLRLLDGYPLSVPVKGSYVPWLPDLIYITSNEPPPFGLASIEAPLMRRIHVIQELPKQEWGITEEALDEVLKDFY